MYIPAMLCVKDDPLVPTRTSPCISRKRSRMADLRERRGGGACLCVRVYLHLCACVCVCACVCIRLFPTHPAKGPCSYQPPLPLAWSFARHLLNSKAASLPATIDLAIRADKCEYDNISVVKWQLFISNVRPRSKSGHRWKPQSLAFEHTVITDQRLR